MIIARDANLDEAIAGAANAIFFNQGQVCVAGSRLFVEEPIFDDVMSGMNRLAKRIEAGTVWVNCHHLIDPALPFGGFKQSGIGREQAADGIELYAETKSVLMRN